MTASLRLTDLNPKWVSLFPGREGMGLRLDCPVHRDAGCARRFVLVMVAPPLDGLLPAPGAWQRTGDTFDDLTLSPSIDAHENLPDGGTRSHWHGWIRNGEVTTC